MEQQHLGDRVRAKQERAALEEPTMATPRNSIAIKSCVLLALLCAPSAVFAAPPAGTVTEINGRLLAKNTFGAVRVLALNSAFQQGDLLAAKQNTYAQVSLADQSVVT